MNFTISIIIPIYNAEKTIQRCLESVFACSDEWYEVIVVDDCSSDRSPEIVKNFATKFLRNEVNLGPGAARNKGALEARGELILFIDSDVLIKKTDFLEIKKYFQAQKSCQTVFFNLCSQDNIKKNFFSDYKNLYMNFILSKFEENLNFVYGACCATRRNNMIPWPEHIRYTEDSLWGYIQHAQGYKIDFLKSVEIIHLKEYNLIKLISNDFKISAYFSLNYFRYNRWNTLYSKANFGHTSKKQKVSLILLGLFFVFLLIDSTFCFPLLFLWVALNADFFIHLETKRGILFAIKSVLWTFTDHIVYLAGIFYGFCIWLKDKNEKREKVIA